MDIPDWISKLFLAIDARDADAFVSFLSEDGTFRYGSQPAVTGQAAVRDHVAGFFAGLEGVRHELQGFWWSEPGRVCFIQGQVTYLLLGGGQATLPFLNTFHMRDDKVGEYLIYADPTPLISPA